MLCNDAPSLHGTCSMTKPPQCPRVESSRDIIGSAEALREVLLVREFFLYCACVTIGALKFAMGCQIRTW